MCHDTVNADVPGNNISCVKGCLLLHFDFVHQSGYIVLNIKFVIISDILIISLLIEFSLSKFYSLGINIHLEIHFKCGYQ